MNKNFYLLMSNKINFIHIEFKLDLAKAAIKTNAEQLMPSILGTRMSSCWFNLHAERIAWNPKLGVSYFKMTSRQNVLLQIKPNGIGIQNRYFLTIS